MQLTGRYGRLLIASCAVMALSGCPGMRMPQGALFSDVSKPPPKTKPATVEYLADNDRPLLEWVLYQSAACDQFGCS